MARHVVLVKHAQPILDGTVPARAWRLGEEGLAQARRLAPRLARFAPMRLVSSPEPKAAGTCEVLSRELGLPMTTADGLREIDRPVLPIMSRAEHDRLNARLFEAFDQPVIGAESAREARDRFDAAVLAEVARPGDDTIVIVAHGTVIALFVAAHNPAVEALALWRRLTCPSFVVLDSSLSLVGGPPPDRI